MNGIRVLAVVSCIGGLVAADGGSDQEILARYGLGRSAVGVLPQPEPKAEPESFLPWVSESACWRLAVERRSAKGTVGGTVTNSAGQDTKIDDTIDMGYLWRTSVSCVMGGAREGTDLALGFDYFRGGSQDGIGITGYGVSAEPMLGIGLSRAVALELAAPIGVGLARFAINPASVDASSAPFLDLGLMGRLAAGGRTWQVFAQGGYAWWFSRVSYSTATYSVDESITLSGPSLGAGIGARF